MRGVVCLYIGESAWAVYPTRGRVVVTVDIVVSSFIRWMSRGNRIFSGPLLLGLACGSYMLLSLWVTLFTPPVRSLLLLLTKTP